ncbi:MAG: translesion error-prone DNA polymerase V autoproteolytic subunit [bacterium]|nr:translesion error-prone DNA polymerase V autoproteolytic subunit [bacterium]
MFDNTIEALYPVRKGASMKFPLYSTRISAGFPSPADDYIDSSLDLNELLIRHPSATFFVTVSGDSMIDAGIHSGDILIVDRAEAPVDRSIVIAVVNGELTVKRLVRQGEAVFLAPENPSYEPIAVTQEMQFEIWGVVLHVIHTPV